MSDGQHGAHGGEQRPLRVVMVSKALVVGA
jgi:hypothetical protein